MVSFLESFRKDFGIIIISALIFLVSFLWKDLLSDIEELYFPKTKGLGGRVMFIMAVTFFILIVVVFIRRFVGLDNDGGNGQQQTQFDDSPLDDAGMDVDAGD